MGKALNTYREQSRILNGDQDGLSALIQLQIEFLVAFPTILIGGEVGYYGGRYQAPVVFFAQNTLQDVPVGSTFGPVAAEIDHNSKGFQFIDQCVQ